MSYIKADNKIEQKHFDFLERLRQSGETNMFGAAPYLEAAYPPDFKNKKDASEILVRWMKAHDDPTRVKK